MTPFVHKAEYIKGFALDLIADQKREWPALAAGKAMRARVITTMELGDHPGRLLDPVMKVIPELRRDRTISRSFPQ